MIEDPSIRTSIFIIDYANEERTRGLISYIVWRNSFVSRCKEYALFYKPEHLRSRIICGVVRSETCRISHETYLKPLLNYYETFIKTSIDRAQNFAHSRKFYH